MRPARHPDPCDGAHAVGVLNTSSREAFRRDVFAATARATCGSSGSSRREGSAKGQDPRVSGIQARALIVSACGRRYEEACLDGAGPHSAFFVLIGPLAALDGADSRLPNDGWKGWPASRRQSGNTRRTPSASRRRYAETIPSQPAKSCGSRKAGAGGWRTELAWGLSDEARALSADSTLPPRRGGRRSRCAALLDSARLRKGQEALLLREPLGAALVATPSASGDLGVLRPSRLRPSRCRCRHPG